ncbi:hypothetical protein HYP58_gp65 [Vibrio phage 1.097.O._10N.286.49.B3]|uniref:Uncharacterized protein n=1 Tax=Vibrio phage 1.097.O._10N.286.49.B3 TaxID=1881383 RepID=A0A2I7R0N9_9CAUD|nr:hypothetical protein HYP58_gp65 [Vibrio phage 1.097.O._10N.286.49.B3]AUR87211.1 hypothetical protein NVP1097O_65 [Vibrio phage 1.097.O._10N.286.49.B3]
MLDSYGNFLWVNKWGTGKRISHMSTTHLFYSLRMAWKARYPNTEWADSSDAPDLHTSDPAYLDEALTALEKELRTRKDLPMHLVEHMGIFNIKKLDALLEEV